MTMHSQSEEIKEILLLMDTFKGSLLSRMTVLEHVLALFG